MAQLLRHFFILKSELDRMNEFLMHILIVLIPLILTNILHMILVKINYLTFIAIPIWKSGFGENKTYRGFFFISIVNSVILVSVDYLFTLNLNNSAILGLILGGAYSISEFPNSFIKRSIGIKSGEKHSKYTSLFLLIDKMDSAFGVTFVYFLMGYVNLQSAFFLFFICSLTHILFSQILVRFNIKKSF